MQCLLCSAETRNPKRPDSKRWFCDKCWFSLSLKTRQRWWKETEYGRVLPNVELMNAAQKESAPQGAQEATV
jgi:transposase-like protein